VAYRSVYPGVDLVYYGNQQHLEFDLAVKPGADPNRIRMKISGAGKLAIDATGGLDIGSGLRIELPAIYQENAGIKAPVSGHFKLGSTDEVGFEVEGWDRARPLIIDPTIVYSALPDIGGPVFGIAVDSLGNTLIAGETNDPDFPIINAVQTSLPGYVAGFVSKINAAGTALLYSTYLGGSGSDAFTGIAVDRTGAAWLTGASYSFDFPLLNPIPSTSGGATVVKLDVNGVLQFSSYLGWGPTNCWGTAIAVDNSGNAYVAGYALAEPFPVTAGAFQTANQGGIDAFVEKVSSSGSQIYSTLLGGSGSDTALGIAVDSQGAAFVTGVSNSASIPNAPAGGAQTTNMGGGDAFIAKLNPTGTSLNYFTFVGGSGSDQGNAIAVDSLGNAYIGGQTSSSGLATAGAAQAALAGPINGFVAQLNPAGTAFGYVTYLGGSHLDYISGLALDSTANAYVTGSTESNSFPSVSAVQPVFPGNGVSLFVGMNSAASWSPIDNNLPGAVLDISPDPAHPGTAAVATRSGFYLTTNSGSSWTLQYPLPFQDSTVTGYVFARSPADSRTIYAEVYGLFYQSTDSGGTWRKRDAPSLTGILADALTANTVYAYYSVSFPNTKPVPLWKSTDGGETWTSAGTAGRPAETVYDMTATADGSLYILESAIYKSTDQGSSWTIIDLTAASPHAHNAAVNSGIPPGVWTHSLASSASTVYFVDGSIYKSTNGGMSWSTVSSPGGLVSFAVAPQNPSVIYAITGNGEVGAVQVSTDGGSTWRAAGDGLPRNWPYINNSSIVVDPNDATRAYITAPVNMAGFVAKLNNRGSALTWSSYLGWPGSNSSFGLNLYPNNGTYPYANGTYPYAIATHGTGEAFVTGMTTGPGFLVTPDGLPTGSSGVFVTKISDAHLRTPHLRIPCSPVVSPDSAQVTPSGGTVLFTVFAQSGCEWSASTGASWASLAGGASGTGVGVITVQAAPNEGTGTRSAALIVGYQTVTITQGSESCAWSLDSNTYTVSTAGGSVAINLTTAPGCPWAVTNIYPWAVTVSSGGSGTGSGTIILTISPNLTGSPRYFYFPIGNLTIQVAQAAGYPMVGAVSLTTGTVGSAYSTSIPVSGGLPAYSNWSLVSGSLPPGLTLDPATGQIRGTPTSASGSPFSFTVTVRDSQPVTSAARTLSIAIKEFVSAAARFR
jgi:Putative Ig domain/Beta-propeller repeat/Putative binding domain, N-terminal